MIHHGLCLCIHAFSTRWCGHCGRTHTQDDDDDVTPERGHSDARETSQRTHTLEGSRCPSCVALVALVAREE
jgi:hypothetical protein